MAADLDGLFIDDLTALFFVDLAGVFLDDFTGVCFEADFTGVLFTADWAADFLELLAICFVLVPCLAPDSLAALLLATDLTGVETTAGVVEAATTGFYALLTGVETFFADCLVADFLVAD